MGNDLTKRFYKMKDTAEIIGVPQTTLRYWEKEFEEIRPHRSSHNQRYFTPSDIEILQIIKYLIKDKGLKIEAAREYLKSHKKNVTKKIEVIKQLNNVKEELEILLNSLNIRGKLMDAFSNEL